MKQQQRSILSAAVVFAVCDWAIWRECAMLFVSSLH
jgi:hypothetical protein